MTDRRPVAVLTAAAHRGGKHIALALADAGWDVAFWGLAAMRARSQQVADRGGRAVVCRGNIVDPVSIRFMIDETLETFPLIDAVVHVAADHLDLAGSILDPATAALTTHGLHDVIYIDAGGVDPGVLSDQVEAAMSLGLVARAVPAISAGRLRPTALTASDVVAALDPRAKNPYAHVPISVEGEREVTVSGTRDRRARERPRR